MATIFNVSGQIHDKASMGSTDKLEDTWAEPSRSLGRGCKSSSKASDELLAVKFSFLQERINMPKRMIKFEA